MSVNVKNIVAGLKQFVKDVVAVAKYHAADIFQRARAAALSAFLATFAVPQTGLFDLATWRAAVVTALIAAFAAVKNVLRNYRYEKVAQKIEQKWREDNAELVELIENALREAPEEPEVDEAP